MNEAYLGGFYLDEPGQETESLLSDDIMDIIYHYTMIEQGFNQKNSTIKEMSGFFETREENLERK